MNISRLTKDLISIVVEALWDEWKLDYISLTKYKTMQDLQDYYVQICEQEKSVPQAYVIFTSTGEVAASCLVDIEDMGVHPQYSPWLANVYTMKHLRNRGYATKLIEYVVLQYPVLHLWTFNKDLVAFYERFGFKFVEQVRPGVLYCKRVALDQGF